MYTIKGADGKDYGPIDADQVRQWIAEGRINAQTQVLAQGATEWRPISALPEFSASFPTLPPSGMGAGPTPIVSVAAQDVVNGPAIGLMVVGILEIIGGICSLIWNLAFSQNAASYQSAGPFANAMVGIWGMLAAALGIILAGLILFGSVKMKKLESYGLAMTASIVAMLPCSLCCIAGLPIGIWSLVVLSKPEVKGAFH